MKPETPVVVDVRAVDVGYFSTKLTLGRKLVGYASTIEAVLKESTDKMVARLGLLDNLDLILFTGGGAKVYFEFFKSRYPKFTNIMFMDDDPFFSNVKDFHVAGEIMSKPKTI